MEHPGDTPKEQLHLFNDKPYYRHTFLPPNVVEIRPVPVENTGHDDFIDNLEAEEVRCKIFYLPRRPDIPDEAA